MISATDLTSTDYLEQSDEERQRIREQQNVLREQQKQTQENIVGQQTGLITSELERNKALVDEDLQKETKAANIDYIKSTNVYGTGAEERAMQGMSGTGLAESTMTKNYNTYQNRVTEAINTTRKIKADFDAKITEAKINGNIDLAKIALQDYQSQMTLLDNDIMYSIDSASKKIQQQQYSEQFDYRKEQDIQGQSNWQAEYDRQDKAMQLATEQYNREFDYKVEQDKQDQLNWQTELNRAIQNDDRAYQQWLEEFKYTKKRDEVSDKQWQAEYNLSKRSVSSGGGSSQTPTLSQNTKQTETAAQIVARLTSLNGNKKYRLSQLKTDLIAGANSGKYSLTEANNALIQLINAGLVDDDTGWKK